VIEDDGSVDRRSRLSRYDGSAGITCRTGHRQTRQHDRDGLSVSSKLVSK